MRSAATFHPFSAHRINLSTLFCPGRIYERGDVDLIRQALADAQAAGRDDMGQTVLAVQAVQQARPDTTAADALAAGQLQWGFSLAGIN